MTYVQMSSKHGRWLDGTLFGGRALMHSLSRNNVTAIDHMLCSVVLKYWGQSVQRNGNTIRQVTDTATYVVSYNLYLCTNSIIKMIINQIIHLPPHFWQFHHAEATNILNGDTQFNLFFYICTLKSGGTGSSNPLPWLRR